MVFNGIDLFALKAPSRETTRYATRLAGVLFSKEELLGGMFPPLNEKYARIALGAEKIEIMRKCIIYQEIHTESPGKDVGDIL